jgi:hypothetical protein
MRNARILQSGSGSLLSALCNWFWIFALAANVVDFAVYENVVRAETDFAIGLAAPASLRADGCAAPGGWHCGSTRACDTVGSGYPDFFPIYHHFTAH